MKRRLLFVFLAAILSVRFCNVMADELKKTDAQQVWLQKPGVMRIILVSSVNIDDTYEDGFRMMYFKDGEVWKTCGSDDCASSIGWGEVGGGVNNIFDVWRNTASCMYLSKKGRSGLNIDSLNAELEFHSSCYIDRIYWREAYHPGTSGDRRYWNYQCASGTPRKLNITWHMPEAAKQLSQIQITADIKASIAKKDGEHKFDDYVYDVKRTFIIATAGPDPMVPTSAFAVDNGDSESAPGKMMCPIVSQTGVTLDWYKIYINGETGGTKHTLSENNKNAYVPISDTPQSVSFEVGGNSIDGIEGHNFEGFMSNTKTVPAYHRLYDVKAEWNTEPKTGLYDGSVKISWNIKNAAEDDYMSSDLFVIERDTLPDFSTAQTIGSVNYEVRKENYEFVDETEVIKRQQASGGKYYYRVYRASASFWTNKQAVDDSGLGGRTSINVPGVWQSEIKYGLAMEASDWNVTRNVNINATVAAGDGFYWDMERVKVFLVKRMISGTDTVTAEILVPEDSVKFEEYNYSVNYTDVADIACKRYAYSLKLDLSNSLLPYSSTAGKEVDMDSNTDFYFNDGMTMDKLSATYNESADMISLSWDTKGGEFQTYTVFRKNNDSFEKIGETDEKSYMDREAPIGAECQYKVVGQLVCDKIVKDSLSVTGRRSEYGSISGHVTYPDGSACGGVTIGVFADDVKEVLRKTVTNTDGSYTIDSLNIMEHSTFTVHPSDDYNSTFNTLAGVEGDIVVALAGTNVSTAYATNISFINTSVHKFSGRVLYDHSTVPVQNAMFRINGNTVINKVGEPVKTDASGNFSLLVPATEGFGHGTTTIQVFKAGHNFANEGFFTDEGGHKEMKIIEDVAGQRIYDETKVTLIGRVTGGKIEGEKPLTLQKGSINTLGDSITLVLELEGDKISHLVHYPTDPDIKTKDTVYAHIDKEYKTTMHTELKRITVHPDPVTGEYMVELFPVKYKIVQATAEGYSTLFPVGMTAQVLDLTNSVTPMDSIPNLLTGDNLVYNDTYSITYRAPIELIYNQLLYGMPKDYLGEERMSLITYNGMDTTINIVKHDTIDKVVNVSYMFGYPVFKSNQTYMLSVAAREKYYYNNDKSEARQWQVDLEEGDIVLFNGMSVNGETLTAPINKATKRASFVYRVDNPSFVLGGEEGLRQLELRIDQDGLYVYSTPVKGYIVGSRLKGTSTVQTLVENICVSDVLRDPYGANSYAYVEGGTTYNAAYSYDLEVTGGVNLGATNGDDSWFSTGIIAAPMGGGVQNSSSAAIIRSNAKNYWETTIKTGYKRHEVAEYTFTTAEKITTSNDPLMVGSEADVYIGASSQMYAAMTDAVVIMDSTTYNHCQPMFEAGKAHLLAEPTEDAPYYLVVREQMEVGRELPVKFVYTQTYILGTLIPKCYQERNSLLMVGSQDDSYWQNLANETKKSIYHSLVGTDDSLFGTKETYKWFKPEGSEGIYVDEVKQYNTLIAQWYLAVADNEKKKYTAILTGKPTTTYSLTSDTEISYNNKAELASGHTDGWMWDPLVEAVPELLTSLVKGAMSPDLFYVCEAFTINVELSIDPFVNVNFTETPERKKGFSKESGFVLQTAEYSYEDIGVYFLKDNSLVESDDYKDVYDDAKGGKHTYSGTDDDGEHYVDFIFARLGGATRCPYEDADVTKVYMPGTQLAPATLRIDNPTVTINTREIGNVPMDQPAVYELTISNESDITFENDFMATTFTLRQDEATNRDGLVIAIDGYLIKGGISFELLPGESVKKTMEVRRGKAYDYDDIGLILRSDCDFFMQDTAKFSVHYQPLSTPVNMALPVKNWILNTMSPKDETGYYTPVEIDGFDVNYDGFDHIDLQYKLNTESDDNWVTLCSFYADSTLYEKASGNKEMIMNGQIKNYKFYGERDPMEQKYDLRAVSYCRLGSSFITRPSELRSGLKDTRRPQLFGVATPANGILGVGDYVSIPFSEDIAANYLDEDNNFEITGYTNTSQITNTTSLRFLGKESSYAATKLSRDLSNKDFSVDFMVKPDTASSMTYVIQGNKDAYFAIEQVKDEKDGKMYLYVENSKKDTMCITKSVALDKLYINEWNHIVVTYENESGEVNMYVNDDRVNSTPGNGAISLNGYKGTGPVWLGRHFEKKDNPFKGCMLEARLWSRVLSQYEVEALANKKLTGYEDGLVAYYPLNEGKGKTAKDLAGGVVMTLNNTEWTYPEGKSIPVKDKSLKLKGDFFSVPEGSDFTYTMWFKVNTKPQAGDSLNLLSSKNMQLKLTDGSMTMINGNDTINCKGSWIDAQWHYFALSANHAVGKGVMFIDGNNVAQFNAHNIKSPSMSGDCIEIGQYDGTVAEVTFWEVALSDKYLKSFYLNTPNDKEMGLITHLPFTYRVYADDGSKYTTEYCPYNCRIRYDENGNVVKHGDNDRVVLNPDSDFPAKIEEFPDGAPVNEKGNIVKYGFNWVGKENELVINLQMAEQQINKQNVFITVRDVEDLAGNIQQSPMQWTLFVDKNVVVWSARYLQNTINEGEGCTFDLEVINQSGIEQNFYINDLPWWLTASNDRGSLSPLEHLPFTFRVSDALEPGEYEAIIHVTDDNELSEPLKVNITVKAISPSWKEDPMVDSNETMNMFAKVQIEGARIGNSSIVYFDTDTADIVAAYLGGICIDVEHITETKTGTMLFMNMKSSENADFKRALSRGDNIRFVLWRASTGQMFVLSPEGKGIKFEANTIVGTPDEPIILKSTQLRSAEYPISAGWNWVSFNIAPDNDGGSFKGAFTHSYQFTHGDFIKVEDDLSSYENGQWTTNDFIFDNKRVFMFRVHNDGKFGIHGTTLKESERIVKVGQGWNYLPYLCEHTQDVTTALGAYDKKTPGDVIKGYKTFAMLDNNYQWVGSLTHLKPGTGYMLYQQAADSAVIRYQNVEVNTPGFRSAEIESNEFFKRSHNMPLIATVEGAEEGDVLEAYAGDELVGAATADNHGRFLMLTSADEGSVMSFRYSGAMGSKESKPVIKYVSKLASVGTLDNPVVIPFEEVSVGVFPNPFADKLTFKAVVKKGDVIEININTTTGIGLWSYRAEADADGLWQYTFTGAENYQHGTYTATVYVNGEKFDYKLIK
ncbi:MAG: hypothetical protein MJ003_00490 [Paludibacteraceae bacterium]|nr:hypothetical protein [Paludibacteraceae bacterium]